MKLRARAALFAVLVAGVTAFVPRAGVAADDAAALDRELSAEREELRLAEEALAQEIARADARARELERELGAAEALAAQHVSAPAPALGDAPVNWDGAVPSAKALIEQLDLQLRELPGGDALRARLTPISAALNEPSTVPDALTALAAFSARVHASTTAVTLERTTLWSAKNTREEVDLLRTGTVAHAYRAAPGRFAVAVQSPEEASGFRWTEDLDEQTTVALSRAFDQVSAGMLTPLIPVDPISSLRSVSGGERSLGDQFGDGGPVMWPLAFIAFVAFALMLERLFTLYVVNRRDPRLLDEVLDFKARGEFDRAREHCGHRRGVVARTLGAVLKRREQGQEAMEDTVQEQMLHELPRLQRFLGGLALLGGIAPLLGLLGTVTGIIDTFRVIHAFGNSDASMMAGGIAEALTTTATGLIIAVPIFVVHGLLKGRAESIVSDAERSAATLLNEVVRPLTRDADPPSSPVFPETAEAVA